MPNFVFNKANISAKHTRDLEIQFYDSVSFLRGKSGWGIVLARRRVGFRFQRRHVGKGVCLCSLQEGWKDMPRLPGDGILYQLQ